MTAERLTELDLMGLEVECDRRYGRNTPIPVEARTLRALLARVREADAAEKDRDAAVERAESAREDAAMMEVSRDGLREALERIRAGADAVRTRRLASEALDKW